MTGKPFTVLVVGGYGTFGSRLVELLAAEPGVRILVGGRSLDKAKALIACLPGADAQPVMFDRQKAQSSEIARLEVDLVVDASGPFQAYGDDAYRLVRETIAAGVNYLDLADSSEFVAGIARLDVAAQAMGVFALSGVSSFPVLSVAAMLHLAQGMDRVTAMSGGIAPSPRAGIGANVVRAILSYAGQPVALIRDGQPSTAHALTESRRYTIAPPGVLPLPSIRFSLIDVPELTLAPPLQPGLQSIWMGAGTRPELLLRMLNLGAWLVRLRLLPPLSWMAGIGHGLMQRIAWGEHRGGMFVELQGVVAGTPTRRSWHLIAEGDHGPFIPVMAAVAVVRRLRQGQVFPPGARPALGLLTLADYEPLFRTRQMRWGTRTDTPDAQLPLYRAVLGDAWEHMPEPVRRMHDFRGGRVVSGRAAVTVGTGLLARIVHRVMGFPKASEDVPVSVTFAEQQGVETWTRRFGDRSFSSVQSAGRGRNQRLVIERFGPVRVAMAVLADQQGLRLVIRSWTLFGIPLPLALGPTTDASEHAMDGRFNFDVGIGHRLTGPIVHYRGWLE